VFDLKKSVEGQGAEGAQRVRCGYAPSTENLCFFYFTIVHSVALSYTNSKVLFAIKCRERYVITGFLAINSDTDIKT